jgi:hypothetical protein
LLAKKKRKKWTNIGNRGKIVWNGPEMSRPDAQDSQFLPGEFAGYQKKKEKKKKLSKEKKMSGKKGSALEERTSIKYSDC